MNIFYIDRDPAKAAISMVDSHVVKMILETAQLLSTAHRVLDGVLTVQNVYVQGSLPYRYRKKKVWLFDKVRHDARESVLYNATHVNHPSAVWVRQSNNNYNWLYCHFLALLEEYTHRYGKVHKCSRMIDILRNPPANIPIGYFTPPTPAMPEGYIVAGNSLESYRYYYRLGKKHLHKYTNRSMPSWMVVD